MSEREDIEMENNSISTWDENNSPQIDATKRLCTDRSESSNSSLETLSLSQVSSALNNFSAACGIGGFRETRLEIVGETEFTWNLENYEESGTSPAFLVAGVPWTISFNHVERTPGNRVVSLHLAVADAKERSSSDPNWAVCAEMILGIKNPEFNNLPAAPAPAPIQSTTTSFLSPRKSSNAPKQFINGHSQDSFHRFCSEEPDWGFSHFCSISAFKTGIPDGSVVPFASPEGSTQIIAKVRVVKDVTGVLWHNFNNYDSKSVTGFVGLLNQGATCYMNSFVQSIFLTNEFRSSVYRIPTENVTPTTSIPLALQRIFYKLQTGSTPPSTTEMTKSFGWDTTESFMQHDVQEFSRVLMEDLENKMKGTDVEGTVERLFRGKLKNVLKCTQVNYESVREESFYDLQMTIKGVKDLQESFERYVAAEMLCGDNQYRTDDFGLQDAKKFATFEHFPPVLHVHLERYAFDMMAEATVKIHDRFEFPVEIALDPYLSETSPDRDNSQTYWLHSVLVHAGDGHGGHYFVYIRHPSKPDCWYKFDDTKVTPCTKLEAVDENFGGYEAVSSEESQELYRSTGVKPYRYKKFTSAYLLVYIRKSQLDTLLAPVAEEAVPEYLIERIQSDDISEARRRHERQQQFLHLNVTLLTQEGLYNYSGADINDPEAEGNVFKLKKELLLSEICEGYLNQSEERGDGYDGTECYPLVARRNKTVRTDSPIKDLDIRTLSSFYSRTLGNPPLTFFIRLTDSKSIETDNLWRQPLIDGKILIFFKWYDPQTDKLNVIGSMPIDRDQIIVSIGSLVIQRLRELGIEYEGSENDLSYSEEFKPSKIVPIEGNTFKDADLRHGDILLVETKLIGSDTEKKGRSVSDYFVDMLSWRQVDIKPVNPQQCRKTCENFKIHLKWSLPELLKHIGDCLEINWDHLRICFTSESNCVAAGPEIVKESSNTGAAGGVPFTSAVKFLKSDNEGSVKDFLIGTSSLDTIVIKYEITKEPAKIAENQVRYFIETSSNASSPLGEVLPQAIYLTPYVSTVSDLIAEISSDFGINNLDPRRFRLLSVYGGKIKKTYSVGSFFESLTPIEPEKCLLYLDEIQEIDENSNLISCFTFEKTPTKPFGIPFKFELKSGETVKKLKSRLSQKLTTTPDNLSLFLFSGSRDRKLDDPLEILSELPGKLSDEDQLAVQMADPRKQRSNSGFDGAIRIRK